MASTDARPVPLKNTAYRHYFCIRKNDGTIITSWDTPDSELSLDGGTMSDATNEAMEIATNSGCGYIDLTAPEMDYDSVVLKVTVANTDAVPYVVTFFPEEAGDIRANVTEWNDVALATTNPLPNAAADAAGGLIISDAGGLDIDAMNTNINDIETDTNALQTDWADGGRLDLIVDAILDDTGTSGVLLASGSITSAVVATDAIDADALATDAVDEIVDQVWDEPLSAHNTGGSAGKALRGAGGIILHSGTSDNNPANTATTISLEGTASTTDDIYTHQTIIITAGKGEGQARVIADYDGATNQSATVTPAWNITPDATSDYEIIPGVVHAQTQGGGYAGGAVWIGPSGSTGTQLYVDGTVDNPIDDGQLANARTVADALNLRVFRIEPTSSITLDQTYNGYVFQGIEYNLNLGTQDASNSYIEGANIQASTVTGSGIIFDNCIFDNAITIPPCVIRNSYFGDTTLSAGTAGNFFFNRCVSRAAGTASPNFDFGAALNSSNLNMRAYSGGIELENMGTGTGTYNASIEGFGALTINANCSATSNIALRGAFKVTDNAGGAVTVVRDDTYTNTSDILVDTADMQPKLGTIADLGGGATLANNLSDMAGATFSTTTDSQEAIRDRGDAAWTTGAGGSDRLLMVDTTIATLSTQVSFTLSAGSADDDAYNGCTIVIEDSATSTQKAIGIIDDYTGSTKTVTLLEDPGVFTMAATDKVYVLAEKGLKPTTAADYHVDVTSGGAVGIDWANVENPTTAVDLSGTDIQLCDTVTTNTDMRGTDSAFLAASAPANIGDLSISETTGYVTVGGFLGGSLTETTGGRIAGNFDTFFENADAATAQTVDDVGSGGGGDASAANQTTIINHLTDVKGTGFAKDTHSLTDITADVTGLNGDAMRGTDSALLAASAPAHFGDLAITVTTGQVTVGTNNDKTGYSISGTITTLDALDTAQDTQHSTTQASIAALNDIAATDIVSGGAITTSGGAVSNVTTVATTTTNTDMRGTDSAALASVCTEARLAELDAANLPSDIAAKASQASVSSLNDISVADVLTTAMTESYGTDGAAVTLAEACYVIMQGINEFAISGTTKTVKQLDGTTTAYTSTLDDATSPTSITRAT